MKNPYRDLADIARDIPPPPGRWIWPNVFTAFRTADHEAILWVAISLWVVFSSATIACRDPKAASPPCKDLDLSTRECAAIYEEALVTCSATSSTLTESIACENVVRQRFGRPLRSIGKDGGS